MIALFCRRKLNFLFQMLANNIKIKVFKIPYIFVFFFCFVSFQIQIFVSYTACHKAPQIQHASREWLQRHHFVLFVNKYFFLTIKDMVNNILE